MAEKPKEKQAKLKTAIRTWRHLMAFARSRESHLPAQAIEERVKRASTQE